ncbi:hypothetical protein PoB_001233900 [Plakobranchus ocellatus]|uniref:Uncharacterized protein n=1 Tax=Plakobranchus ocellatus TaxID=259542 RepID=A0AAV3YUW6_9GAST|nr:hypothetical protein PoB_001233900 [Plakobranchus ocellatus]
MMKRKEGEEQEEEEEEEKEKKDQEVEDEKLHQQQESQQSHPLITIDTPETAATTTDNPKTLQNSSVILNYKAALDGSMTISRC